MDFTNSHPTIIQVSVGQDQYQFTPSNVTAKKGDIIKFIFYPTNHSVVQSTFGAPCEPLAGGFAGAFHPQANSTNQPRRQYTVNDDTKPLWFYCSQVDPVDHCTQGMVFAINPGPAGSANSFDKFRQNALASGSAFSPSASNGADASSTSLSSTATQGLNTSSGTKPRLSTNTLAGIIAGLGLF